MCTRVYVSSRKVAPILNAFLRPWFARDLPKPIWDLSCHLSICFRRRLTLRSDLPLTRLLSWTRRNRILRTFRHGTRIQSYSLHPCCPLCFLPLLDGLGAPAVSPFSNSNGFLGSLSAQMAFVWTFRPSLRAGIGGNRTRIQNLETKNNFSTHFLYKYFLLMETRNIFSRIRNRFPVDHLLLSLLFSFFVLLQTSPNLRLEPPKKKITPPFLRVSRLRQVSSR